jgi:hypothetical protein
VNAEVGENVGREEDEEVGLEVEPEDALTKILFVEMKHTDNISRLILHTNDTILDNEDFTYVLKII